MSLLCIRIYYKSSGKVTTMFPTWTFNAKSFQILTLITYVLYMEVSYSKHLVRLHALAEHNVGIHIYREHRTQVGCMWFLNIIHIIPGFFVFTKTAKTGKTYSKIHTWKMTYPYQQYSDSYFEYVILSSIMRIGSF